LGAAAIINLLQALDEYVQQPLRKIDQSFLMPIEDVFSISGQGTVETARVERGVVERGDQLEIVGIRETI
jgi:elongation factor Tu